MLKNFNLYFFLILWLISILNASSINSVSKNDFQNERISATKIDRDCDDKKISSLTVTDALKLKKCDPCPNDIKCVPKIQCPAHVQMKNTKKPQICDLPAGQSGFCCTTGQNFTDSIERQRRTVRVSQIDQSIVEEAQEKFSNFLNDLTSHHRTLQTGHPDSFHQIAFHSAMPNHFQTMQLSNSAMQQAIASQIFKEREHISVEDLANNNVDVSFHSSELGELCSHFHSCPSSLSKYRTIDGSCNNPTSSRSLWGAAGQPMERVLFPAYEDGIWKPRMHSVDGSALSSARHISRILFKDVNRPHPQYNLLLMQFGQFISHDVTQSASIKQADGQDIECCIQNGFESSMPLTKNLACFPIPIASNDEFYSAFNQRCMNFVRIALALNSNCKVGYGKQISKVTHYLDASQIYGSDPITARDLRTFRNGQLRMLNSFERDLLPLTRDPQACGDNQSNNNNRICFQAGDGRTNQIISLTLLHTIFAREHNRIAGILARLNPKHSDEILYQEARRIVVAEYQHVIFNEWLPLVIGGETMRRFGLTLHHHSYSTDYSTDVNPAVTSEFTAAALRFGHSTVDGLFRIRRHSLFEEKIRIPDVMFNPTRLQQDNSFLNDLVNTLTEQPMQKFDDSISHGLTRFLFRGSSPFGLDLAAINIQRGRDHALRPYNDYLELTGRQRIKSFNRFSSEVANKLRKVYSHPDDIDLWVGGLLEKSFSDSIVGPTFVEIIADQFSRLRRGDRYFYEHDPTINPGHFNHNQLKEIRKVRMARILCDNLDSFSFNAIPYSAFLRSGIEGNTPINCDSRALPKLNLNAWKI